VINELERRKPDWVEGDWAVLADFQKWAFPRPKLRFRPMRVDGKIQVGGGRVFGPEYDESLSIILGTKEAESFEILTVKFDMAVRLLQSNYNLTDDETFDLLSLDLEDPASVERFDVVSNILAGIAPKPSADTSTSPL
jgi:hypothetical protein